MASLLYGMYVDVNQNHSLWPTTSPDDLSDNVWTDFYHDLTCLPVTSDPMTWPVYSVLFHLP